MCLCKILLVNFLTGLKSGVLLSYPTVRSTTDVTPYGPHVLGYCRGREGGRETEVEVIT